MTQMNTFIEKEEYQQLLFAALGSLPGLELIRSDANIELMPPAIRKPKELWTGKQVISTLLNHLRKGNDRDEDPSFNFQGLSMERKTKTPATAFGASYNEHMVIIRDGDLLQGVLDKAAFGASDFSLVHAVFEGEFLLWCVGTFTWYGPEFCICKIELTPLLSLFSFFVY